jgi:hypothetical protein
MLFEIKGTEILNRYKNNESIASIARKCGTTRSSIYRILKEKFNLEIKSGEPKYDLTGQTFGFLYVIEMAITPKSTKGTWRAICKCLNCGNECFDANVQSLRADRTTSCGCRRDQYEKITGERNKGYKGYKDIRGKTWSKIKRTARRRNVPFEITIEEAWEIFEKQNRKCALSGIPLNFGKAEDKLKLTTASLDRIDSSKRYSKENVQWVHKDINIIKSIFSEEYFVNLCRLVAKNNLEVPFLSGEELVKSKIRWFGDRRISND